MAGEIQDDTWPLPAFHFSVALGDDTAGSFAEVSGLDSEPEVVAYRHGDSPVVSSPGIPGAARTGSVTLRRGIFANDASFWSWYDRIKLNTVDRSTVVISLLDETATPTMTWTLLNARPARITGTVVTPDENEVAVESLEVAYETLVVAAP